jgi:peptidoglycan/xylan/chitin deacetylase (PgdA/CDA1 family)
VRRVTLTFDNGPEPRVTPQVLDSLARHDAKAAFFVLGKKLLEPANLAIAKRARAEGHWIGNHTFSHAVRLGKLNRASALEEFDKTEQALAWLAQPVRLFRPPGGGGELGPSLLHPAVVERLQEGGYNCVLWNSVPGDWHDPQGWPERALKDCATRDWSLVVLHDLPTGAMAHLDSFLLRLREEGFEMTQEFPPECIPIVNGRIVLPIEQYMRS